VRSEVLLELGAQALLDMKRSLNATVLKPRRLAAVTLLAQLTLKPAALAAACCSDHSLRSNWT